MFGSKCYLQDKKPTSKCYLQDKSKQTNRKGRGLAASVIYRTKANRKERGLAVSVIYKTKANTGKREVWQ